MKLSLASHAQSHFKHPSIIGKEEEMISVLLSIIILASFISRENSLKGLNTAGWGESTARFFFLFFFPRKADDPKFHKADAFFCFKGLGIIDGKMGIFAVYC